MQVSGLVRPPAGRTAAFPWALRGAMHARRRLLKTRLEEFGPRSAQRTSYREGASALNKNGRGVGHDLTWLGAFVRRRGRDLHRLGQNLDVDCDALHTLCS